MSSDYEADTGSDPRDDLDDTGDTPAADPIPRDEWVSRVIADPSTPSNAVLLSGYVGDAAEAGRTRIYTDASLAHYVEVDDNDVLHYEPLEGDAVPAGGAMVWVKGDAMVTPGPAAGQAGGQAGGDFFTGPVMDQHMPGAAEAAGAGGPGGQMQITLLTVAGCLTRWTLCRTVNIQQCIPNLKTLPIICSRVCREPWEGITQPGPWGGPAPVAGGINAAAAAPGGTVHHPSFGFTCTAFCPENTAATQCTHPGPIGHTGWLGCTPTKLIGCTGWLGCGEPHISLPGCIHTGTCSAVDACPTRLCGSFEGTDTVEAAAAGPVGVTGWLGCTHMIGCPSSSTCTPEGPIGVTGWRGCTQMMGCPQTSTCTPHTHAMGCPDTSTCTPDGGTDTVHAAAAGAGPDGPTAWLGCTQMMGCPQTSTCTPQTHALGCPRTSTCTPTAMLGCPPTRTCPPTSMFGCPRTSTCPPTAMPGCPNTRTCPPTMQLGCPRTRTCPPTAMLGCPPTRTCPPTSGFGCPNTRTCPPTSMFGCPNTRTCTPGGTDTIHAAGAEQVGPTGWLHCTQMMGCPNTSTCTPHTHAMGCPSSSTCGPEADAAAGPGHYTHAMGCPSSSSCRPEADAAAGPYGPTAWLHCTQMLGCPSTSTCPPQAGGAQNAHPTVWTQIGCITQGLPCPGHTQVCPTNFGCPDPATFGPTGTLHCTHMMGCPNTSTCTPHTHMPGCPSSSTCTPQDQVASQICATNIACNITIWPPC